LPASGVTEVDRDEGSTRQHDRSSSSTTMKIGGFRGCWSARTTAHGGVLGRSMSQVLRAGVADGHVDIQMPGMSGSSCVAGLRAITPASSRSC
jgi:hypothetical protein